MVTVVMTDWLDTADVLVALATLQAIL